MFDLGAWLSYHISQRRRYLDEIVNYINYLRLERFKRRYTPIQYGVGVETYLPAEIQDGWTFDLYTLAFKHHYIFNTVPSGLGECQIQLTVWEIVRNYLRQRDDGDIEQASDTRYYYMLHPYRRQRMIARQVPIIADGNYITHRGHHQQNLQKR